MRMVHQRRTFDCGICAVAMLIKRAWKDVYVVRPVTKEPGYYPGDLTRMIKRLNGQRWQGKRTRRIPLSDYAPKSSRSILMIYHKKHTTWRGKGVEGHFVTQIDGVIYDPNEKEPLSPKSPHYRNYKVLNEIIPVHS